MGDLSAKHGEAILALRNTLALFEKLGPAVTASEDRADFYDKERIRRIDELSELQGKNASLRLKLESLQAKVESLENAKSWTACLEEFKKNHGCPFCMSNMHAHDINCHIYKLEKSLGEQSYKAHLAELRAEAAEKDAKIVDEMKKLVNHLKERLDEK